MNARPDFSALPESVLKAFEGKPSLPLGETATVLGMNEKTLKQHVAAGNISYLAKGFGQTRPRREFTLNDVAFYYSQVRVEASNEVMVRPPAEFVTGPRIYFIRSGGYVKIGRSMQIGQRFAALQIAHPEHLDLVFHCEGGAREEEALHRQFAAYRVRGEWFRFDREIQEWIVRQKEAEHAR